MPVFMRAGCNTGSCHGAARGKDGFRLSLFGFDPDGDYDRLTHEIGFPHASIWPIPQESLLLEKSIGAVPHTGGKKFAPDSEYYATHSALAGSRSARRDPGPTPAITSVEIYPPQAVLEGEGTTQQFVARAMYADGTDRDVTDLAVFLTNNDNSAPINADGMVTAAARGEAFVMARFETHTVGSQVLVLPKDLKTTPPTTPPANYIDELVNAKLERIRMLPSDICSDEVFPPPSDDRYYRPTAHAEEHAPNSRQTRRPTNVHKLVDRLLERKEFSEIWAMKWANLLLVKSGGVNNVQKKPVFLYANWLTNQIAEQCADQPDRKAVAGGQRRNVQ